MANNGSKGYDNALTKMLKQFKAFVEEICEGEPEYIESDGPAIILFPDGSGKIVASHLLTPTIEVYEFLTPEELTEYLTASQVKRIMLSRHTQ